MFFDFPRGGHGRMPPLNTLLTVRISIVIYITGYSMRPGYIYILYIYIIYARSLHVTDKRLHGCYEVVTE